MKDLLAEQSRNGGAWGPGVADPVPRELAVRPVWHELRNARLAEVSTRHALVPGSSVESGSLIEQAFHFSRKEGCAGSSLTKENHL